MNESMPTLHDVARHAGVSPATVSRVLNKTALVNPRTLERVRASIEELHYTPVLRPQALPEPAGTIALIITDILNPFFPEIVRGVEDELSVHGYLMLLHNTLEDPRRERHALSLFSEQNVHGIIVCASRLSNDDLIEVHQRYKTPLVVLNKRIEYPGIHSILVDMENATYRATQHLLQLHHSRIGFLAGYPSFASSQVRRRGIETALSEKGMTLRDDWCMNSSVDIEGGFQAMSALLARSTAERPTGIIAYNDIIALGALHAIRVFGLRVPEDISIVGVDGISLAAHFNPPLTTIDQPKYRMGQIAMHMIRRMLAGQHPPDGGFTLLESPLIVRESTAVAKED